MADPTLSLIIPTIGRPTLARCLLSVRDQDWRPGDEILLVGDGPQPVARAFWEQLDLPGRFVEVPGPYHDWGHTPRNRAIPQARGEYLMALDDDDELTPGAVAVVRAALAENPGRPHLFRMHQCFNGATVWRDREVREGNVGTPMFVTPAGRVGRYEPRYGGDYDFIRGTVALYPPGALVWREEVICRVRPYSPHDPRIPATV